MFCYPNNIEIKGILFVVFTAMKNYGKSRLSCLKHSIINPDIVFSLTLIWKCFCFSCFKYIKKNVFFCLQVPLFLSLPCGSSSLRFGWSPQPSGRQWNRKLCQIMGCLRSLYLWLQRLCLNFSPLGSGLNSYWVSEHGWGRVDILIFQKHWTISQIRLHRFLQRYGHSNGR